jgi:N6-adenosine-specific RNA methylase IME4
MNLPSKKYDVILIDPPWSYYGQQDKWGAAAKFYETMSDEELRRMPVGDVAKKTSVLFCWATGPRLDIAIDLIRSWGFAYRGAAFVWVKTTKAGVPIGARGVRPSIVKPTSEFVLAGSMTTKGRPMPIADESVAQVVLAPLREHSRKPDEIQDRINRLYPNATKLEMFARQRRDGWDSWGNEVPTDGVLVSTGG